MMTQEVDQNIQSLNENIFNLKQLCESFFVQLEQTQNPDDLADVRRQIFITMVQLRELNRQAQESVNNIKNTTRDHISSVDKSRLEIENVLYKQRNLRYEIQKCADYRSKHETVELVDLETFHADTNNKYLSESPHTLMLERLNDEERRRKELQELRTKLEEQKKGLQKECAELKDKMSQIDKKFKVFEENALETSKELETF